MQFSRVALVTNFNISEKAEAARTVASAFSAHGVSLMLDLSARGKCGFEAAGFTPRYVAAHTIYECAELVAVIGGDGSVLEAARRAAARNIPVLGVNKGRLGFLCELELDELDLIDRLYSGGYTVEKHSMLNVEVMGRPENGERRRLYIARALNDAVVSNGAVARIVDIELSGLLARTAVMGYDVTVSPEVREQIIREGYDPRYGARPIRRAIQTHIEDVITDILLNQPAGQPIVV